MTPTRRMLSLICALTMTGVGAYFFFDWLMLFAVPNWRSRPGSGALTIATAGSVAVFGVYWLWIDFIDPVLRRLTR
jgi:hypothetical protein